MGGPVGQNLDSLSSIFEGTKRFTWNIIYETATWCLLNRFECLFDCYNGGTWRHPFICIPHSNDLITVFKNLLFEWSQNYWLLKVRYSKSHQTNPHCSLIFKSDIQNFVFLATPARRLILRHPLWRHESARTADQREIFETGSVSVARSRWRPGLFVLTDGIRIPDRSE